MRNRDDFNQKTKDRVAARAGWCCSLCGDLTVGPSEESSSAVTMIGVAAHICAAAPGPGSRRYSESMTSEERSSIHNAIWLCADHAVAIDRDEVTYSVEALQTIKQRHEASCGLAIRMGTNLDIGAGLLAIGHDLVFSGDVIEIAAASWTLRLQHPMLGDIHGLIKYIDQFSNAPAMSRYVLSNELGDGRSLLEAPILSKEVDGYRLVCPVAPGFPRVDAQSIGSGMALHPETHDLYLDARGNIARVSGLDYLPQKIESALSMQQNENVFAPSAGGRFFEYYEGFKGSPWLTLLMKLDVIRQAAIPFTESPVQPSHTPLRCVTRVRDLELLADAPTKNRLPIRLDRNRHEDPRRR